MAYCHYTSLSIMSLLTHGRHGINNDDGTSRIHVNVDQVRGHGCRNVAPDDDSAIYEGIK